MKNLYRLFIAAAFIAALIMVLTGCVLLVEPDERVSETGVAVKPEETPRATSEPTQTPEVTPEATQQPETNIEAVFYIDLNDDGVDEEIAVISTDDGYGSYDIILEVSGDGESNEVLVDWGYSMSALMAQTQRGDPCVLVSADYASDDYWTAIVSFDGMVPVIQGEFDGYVDSVSENNVVISDDVDVLGSWNYDQHFEILNDFSLQPLTDKQIVISEWREPLVNIKELPVEMLEGGVYEAHTLGIGTAIYPVSTDGETYLNFKLDDDSQGRISFTRDTENYWLLIDGSSEDEYFEGLEYWD